MSFSIDRQTLDELNLLGKFRQGSIYHLFSRVKTQGGERLLEHMFRNPLTDHMAINDRSGIFQAFQRAAVSFPFDPGQIALMREYLDTGSGKNAMLTFLKLFIKKGLASLTRDERFKKNVQGLQATIVTLNRCAAFLQGLPADMGPFSQRVQQIRDLLSAKHFRQLLSIDIYTDLPVKTLAFYDHQLKVRSAREMEDLLDFIYEADVYVAVSDIAKNKRFGYAVALPSGENKLSASNLRHPGIDRAIGNKVNMHRNSNVIFLTGANMAGKSTLMKSIGIALYLAHMGFPVAASEMHFSVREGLYTSINVADNIGLGYSHFYAEVVRVKRAADAAASGKRLLLMFDELFKGTNVKDAYDGTLAVTQGFADYRECLFIVSTHIIEVGDALKGHDNIRFVYMPTVMDGVHPRYTYELQEGITEDRQGMMIIRNEGILELLTE